MIPDLTSSYFESDPPDDDEDKRQFGYSRDKRNDELLSNVGDARDQAAA